MDKIKYIFLLVFSFVLIANNTQAYPICDPGFRLDRSGLCMPADTGLSEMTVSEVLITFLNWTLSILAVIAVIAFVISGIQYITSAGNENQIENAKRNLTWAIVGLAVSLAAIVILRTIEGIMYGNIF